MCMWSIFWIQFIVVFESIFCQFVFYLTQWSLQDQHKVKIICVLDTIASSEYQVRCPRGQWEWVVTRVQFQMIPHFTQMQLFGMNSLDVQFKFG